MRPSFSDNHIEIHSSRISEYGSLSGQDEEPDHGNILNRETEH